MRRLEDRTTPSTLIPVSGAQGLVFDASRNRLCVTTTTGRVARYDVGTGTLLTAIQAGSPQNGADITPDGRYSAHRKWLRALYPNPAHQGLPAELFGVPGYFGQCLECGSVVHSLPIATAACECGNVEIDPLNAGRVFQKPDRVHVMTLIGKCKSGS